MVRAVKFCHDNGVAHRDVKLSNVTCSTSSSGSGGGGGAPLFDPQAAAAGAGGFPPAGVMALPNVTYKLADFGMAAFIGAGGRPGMLRGRCGTPGYVAPEILKAKPAEWYPANNGAVDMFR